MTTPVKAKLFLSFFVVNIHQIYTYIFTFKAIFEMQLGAISKFMYYEKFLPFKVGLEIEFSFEVKYFRLKWNIFGRSEMSKSVLNLFFHLLLSSQSNL